MSDGSFAAIQHKEIDRNEAQLIQLKVLCGYRMGNWRTGPQ